MKKKSLTILWVTLKEIQPYPHNPASRIESLKDLVASISEDGFDPSRAILIGSDWKTIGDGNRRFAAAKELGLQKVPIIIDEKHTAEEIYRSHNSTQKPITMSQGLEWYLSNLLEGVKVTTTEIPGISKTGRRYIGVLESLGGKKLLLKVSQSGNSPSWVQRLRAGCKLAYGDREKNLGPVAEAFFGGKINGKNLRALTELGNKRRVVSLLNKAMR